MWVKTYDPCYPLVFIIYGLIGYLTTRKKVYHIDFCEYLQGIVKSYIQLQTIMFNVFTKHFLYLLDMRILIANVIRNN